MKHAVVSEGVLKNPVTVVEKSWLNPMIFTLRQRTSRSPGGHNDQLLLLTCEILGYVRKNEPAPKQRIATPAKLTLT
jgi:hypothetical protein